MKRWLLKLALFLVLGAIGNIAVAWSCALSTPLADFKLAGDMIYQYRFGATDLHQQIGNGPGQQGSDYQGTMAGWPTRSIWLVQMRPTYTLLASTAIWPGFAINTVFYAIILWLLFAAPFALRKRRRIKRGLCPQCAYDLRGAGSDSKACPECGAAIGKQKAQTQKAEMP